MSRYRKYNHVESIDLIDGQFVPLYHPGQQSRSNHFVWSNDFTEMIGVSPSGRATIVRLQLNRDGIVNSSRVLQANNLHPLN